MQSPDLNDNTSIIRMKRGFDAFLQGTGGKSGISKFSLNQSDLADDSFLHGSGNVAAISVQSLFEKEREGKLKDAEILAAKSEIAKLQAQINSAETSTKRARIEYDRDLENLIQEREREKEKMKELRSEVHRLKTREAQTREELLEAQREVDRSKRLYEERLLQLQKDKIQLEEDMQQAQEQAWERLTEVKRDLMRNETELKICQGELEETKTQLRLQLKRSSDITSQMKELEDYKLKAMQAEEKIKELELQISTMEADHTVAQALKSQLTTFLEMEKENRKLTDENQYLRDIQENNMLLKEQNEGMKKKIERLEERMSDYASLQLQNEDLQTRLQKWEASEKGKTRLQSPAQLNKRVVELQNSQAVMLANQGQLQTSLHAKEVDLKHLQEQNASLSTQIVQEKSKTQQQQDFIKRLQRKLLLVTKERDGYKRIIDSYESEVTVSVEATAMNRVQQLEAHVEGYQKNTEMLEAELSKAGEELAAVKAQNKQLEHRLRQAEQGHLQTSTEIDQQIVVQLREKITELEKALEKCEEEKFVLETRIEQRHLQGDYDPSNTKVVHFKMNPASIAQTQRTEEMRLLKEENERLQQRVKLLEESGGKMEDLTMAVEQKLQEPGASKDIEDMKEKLSSAELKNKRLMEAFKKTSQEFREVCYQLTGYKIDIPCSNQYRLTSMYAGSQSEYLLFQQSSSGELQLLGTDFSNTLDELIEMYLQRQDSIPAFLSSVTLDLFGRQTMNLG